MKTEWDYTNLADAYLKRPEYSKGAIDQMLQISGVHPGDPVCDVGAGAAHLTLKLAQSGLEVTAVEPNDAMRSQGIRRTGSFKNVRWFEGTGEKTGQAMSAFRLVTFGSSFNVTDRRAALQESSRILQEGGWFACLWNHRNLEDPLQLEIEEIIQSLVPKYDYGIRRQDQTEVIQESGLFGEVRKIDGSIFHSQSVTNCIEAWRSHATLSRQAGSRFAHVVQAIQARLEKERSPEIRIPYITRIWMAPVKKRS